MKRYLPWLIAVLALLLCFTGVATFVLNVRQLRGEIENTFLSRQELVGKFVAQHRDQLTVMRLLLMERYHSQEARRMTGLQPQAHASGDYWSLAQGRAAGIVSGAGPLPLRPQQQREIVAAMGMEAQIRSALQFSPDVAWLYYLSASHFVYMAPATPVERFHFTPALYGRGYWQDAMPSANRERRMVIKGPIKDLAGQGWILTFAEPIHDGEIFLGVVALDLRIDTLQQLINVGESTGKTMIVSENEHLVASQGNFEPGSLLITPLSEQPIDWRQGPDKELWLSSPVVPDELWLVHRLGRSELYEAAARESLASWLLTLMLGGLAVLAWRLKAALTQVTRLTHIDPLTQALNRRGLHEESESTLALARRKQLPLALMLLDIDHFKKINDSHGHAVGDSVLQQLGDHVHRACRASDLFCRWGGEEFVLILALDQVDQALPVAERMRQEAQRTRIQPGDLPITLSGGLVLMRETESIDDAVARADTLLYQAKTGGRNRIMAELSLDAV